VLPLMGTDSSFKLSSGNVYPAIARPWGMNAWTPQRGIFNRWVLFHSPHRFISRIR